MRHVWEARLSKGSLSPPPGSIILYKMIICLLSNGFEETIWIRLLLQHAQIVRIVKYIDKDHLCNLDLCLFYCSVIFHDNKVPLQQKQFSMYKPCLTYLVHNNEIIKNLSDLPSGQRCGISTFVQNVWWKLEGHFFFVRKSISLF